MWIECSKCGRGYQDEAQWTICPHQQAKDDPYPAISRVLKFFAYSHLPEKLQAVSRPFGDLARLLAERAPENEETAVALRKLLEAKDAAVRAAL